MNTDLELKVNPGHANITPSQANCLATSANDLEIIAGDKLHRSGRGHEVAYINFHNQAAIFMLCNSSQVHDCLSSYRKH
jgi:hypothetical protein